MGKLEIVQCSQNNACNYAHGNSLLCALRVRMFSVQCLLTLTAFGNVVNFELCISSSFSVSFTPKNTCSSMSSSGVSLMMILCASTLRNIVPNRIAKTHHSSQTHNHSLSIDAQRKYIISTLTKMGSLDSQLFDGYLLDDQICQ